MNEFFIAVVVILWVVSAINSVRKAMAKAQAAAGGPDAIRAASDAAAQNEAASRTAATQRVLQALRARSETQQTGATRYVSPGQRAATAGYSSPPLRTTTAMASYSSPLQATAPPADQAMSSLIPMEAPRMPTFDAPGLDIGSGLNAFGAPDPGGGASIPAALAGRNFLLTEGATAGAAAIVAAAIIGPPIGLRITPQIASDW
jgi:hypothetical protein